MEFKVQEKLTTKKIEYDLKKGGGLFSVLMIILSIVATASLLFPITVLSNGTNDEGAAKYLLIGILVILILLVLFLWIITAYVVYMRFVGYKKFKIGVDVLVGFEVMEDTGPFIWFRNITNKNEYADIYYLKFARFGRFRVHSRAWYYTWSENYKTHGHNMEDSFRVGDRVYVVLVGKRIVNVFNDKMFDLSETLMRERLMDDVELHRQYKLSEQEEQQ